MADITAKANAALQEKSKEVRNPMAILLAQMSKSIKNALPSHLSSERFQRVALTAFNSNPKLQKCSTSSFLAAMMTSAQLGLEPNTPLGQAYLIPYGNSVQFQIGYQGIIDTCYRTGEFNGIGAYEVYENDEFDLSYGINPTVKHKPAIRGDRGAIIGYYGYYSLKSGGSGVFYMTKENAEKWGQKFSKTFGSGPWQTDFDAMAKKTVLKQALKYAPKSIEMSKVLSTDETTREDFEKPLEDADTIPVSWNEIDVDKDTGEVKEDVK